jgi:hypothetical protein
MGLLAKAKERRGVEVRSAVAAAYISGAQAMSELRDENDAHYTNADAVPDYSALSQAAVDYSHRAVTEDGRVRSILETLGMVDL